MIYKRRPKVIEAIKYAKGANAYIPQWAVEAYKNGTIFYSGEANDELFVKTSDGIYPVSVELLNIINNAMKLYGETCKRIREETVGTYVCNMCKWDCNHGPDECPGFETNDCFELDNAKYMSIIFKASE